MFQSPELDITKEINDLLFTSTDCTPMNVPFITRRFRRDDNLEKIACPSCNSDVNGIIEGREGCPYCQGEGYLWDELIIKGWLLRRSLSGSVDTGKSPTEAGRDTDKTTRLVTPSDTFIYVDDIIKVIKLDENKRIAIPLTIYDTYKCYYSERYSSNQSNSEFNIAGLQS